MKDTNSKYSDPSWLMDQGFSALVELSRLLDTDEDQGRDALIRTLEHRTALNAYSEILNGLIQKAGLYPYLTGNARLTTSELINYEYHNVEGMEGFYMHSKQAKVYRALLDGQNVILSAPTSFGKSLLIHAMVATGHFNTIVVIVPTIALIDETRRRLSERFSENYKVITHLSQQRTGKDIFVLTQERFIEIEEPIQPDFFVIDEFYKLCPSRSDQNDERTFVLNQAFYQLIKSGAQFFLIGPNVNEIQIDHHDLDFRFYKFDYTTVATEIRYSKDGNQKENALDICRQIDEPTLIFCKSTNSAYALAEYLIENGVAAATDDTLAMAAWLRENYHPEWALPKLLDAGFAVHHGSLPRSTAYHILRKFNERSIRFLLCTSTVIEGVNTSAKNIIIYDNKIATTKFDLFTFNNIKGRAGRMFEHFVGHVYVLHPEPDPELPIIDIPSITQSENTPESLLIHIDEKDLSEKSQEQLRYLHAQDYLPIEVIRRNSAVEPRRQVELAAAISGDIKKYYAALAWKGHPNKDQLHSACELIFEHLMGGKPRDGISSAKQLAFQISRLSKLRDITKVLTEEIQNSWNQSPSQAVETTLKMLRQWGEFHFPRYLTALGRIQEAVFTKAGLEPGDYSVFASAVKHLFMHPAATVLEEYGIPYKLTNSIVQRYDLGDNIDSFLSNLKQIDPNALQFSNFEKEMFKDAIGHL